MLFPLPSYKPLLFLCGSHHLVTPLFLLRVSHLGASGSSLLIRSKTSFYKQLSFLLHPDACCSSWWLQHVCWWVLQQWTLGFLTFSYLQRCFLLLYLSYPSCLDLGINKNGIKISNTNISFWLQMLAFQVSWSTLP